MLQKTHEIQECLFQIAVIRECPRRNYSGGGLGEYLIHARVGWGVILVSRFQNKKKKTGDFMLGKNNF